MPFKSREPCKNVGSFQLNSVGTITFKISDLKRDVDSIKATYECGSDPNKPRIERVLTNMKRKILKAEQIMKFGQNITGRTVTQDRTRCLHGRVATIKSLFKELMKDQSVMTKQDRRALWQMYHQLLSMEDDLVHFTEPVHEHASSTSCKNNGESPFTSIKDCEVQTTKNENCPAPSRTTTLSPCKSTSRIRPFVYTGIGFSRPEIELNDLSSSSVEEPWKTMFSFNTERRALQYSQDVSTAKPESSLCPSVSANDSLVSVSLYMSADESSDTTKSETTSDSYVPIFAGLVDADPGHIAECTGRLGVKGESENSRPTSSNYGEKQDDVAHHLHHTS